jgi:D-galactose 1-dehydrogenase
MNKYKVAIIGVGKIVEDQHLPVIARSPRFELAAVASQRGVPVEGAPTFRTPEEMYRAVPDIDAVAVCTPPQVRWSYAREAIAAGKHVLLEKPSTATVGELIDLRDYAATEKRVIFTTWHSQYNAAVEAAARALAGQTVKYLQINWKEDVRRWHPGQKWIWLAGGFGVFDPGINALSIVTRILPDPIFIRRADLMFPDNCDAPIAARIDFSAAKSFEHLRADFDWRQTGEQTWEIQIDTEAGNRLTLAKGGSRLDIDGKLVAEEPMAEYEGIYDRFATLLDDGRSLVDEAPMRLAADAFLIGKRITTEPFYD